jgi:hypothetical protein
LASLDGEAHTSLDTGPLARAPLLNPCAWRLRLRRETWKLPQRAPGRCGQRHCGFGPRGARGCRMVSLWAACPVCSHTQRASLQRRRRKTAAAQDLAAALPASAAHPRLPQHVLASPSLSVRISCGATEPHVVGRRAARCAARSPSGGSLIRVELVGWPLRACLAISLRASVAQAPRVCAVSFRHCASQLFIERHVFILVLLGESLAGTKALSVRSPPRPRP